MKLVITIEQRFNRTPDGAVWTETVSGYSFWTHYLEVFDTVQVVARVQNVGQVQPDWIRADGPGVAFAPLPYYIGPTQYLRQARALRRRVAETLKQESAVILRVPSQIAVPAFDIVARRQQPFGVEVVGDPYDVFASGAVSHPLRLFFRWWFVRQQKIQCTRASAAAYVTASALQTRYPASSDAFTTHYSSIELDDAAFISMARTYQQSECFTLITVASLAQLYKAPDVLIDAVTLNVTQGMDLRLVIVGDGKYRAELEARAARAGLAQRVQFVGQVPAGEAVRAQLDQADVFVLPSRTEGLPRAMIEAMARGLPCIGSTVGGIPELLPPDDMVPPGDVQALAAKIREVLTNPARMVAMSSCNLEVARGYHESILHQRRAEFYRYVKEKTQAWLENQ